MIAAEPWDVEDRDRGSLVRRALRFSTDTPRPRTAINCGVGRTASRSQRVVLNMFWVLVRVEEGA